MLPLFPLCYTGSIEYFTFLIKYDDILFEQYEFVPKQTTRTFLEILSANGIQKLSIPINNKSQKIPYLQITIDNKQRWQHQHWQSIISAYNSSPFFEHYEHLLEPVFSKKYDLLFDFNFDLFNVILKSIKINSKLNFSEFYIENFETILDYRNKESFKKTRTVTIPEYNQVFSYKQPFATNLSILDLLFNIGGPEAKKYLLENSIS